MNIVILRLDGIQSSHLMVNLKPILRSKHADYHSLHIHHRKNKQYLASFNICSRVKFDYE